MAKYDVKKTRVEKAYEGIKANFRPPAHARASLYVKYLEFAILTIQAVVLILILGKLA